MTADTLLAKLYAVASAAESNTLDKLLIQARLRWRCQHCGNLNLHKLKRCKNCDTPATSPE